MNPSLDARKQRLRQSMRPRLAEVEDSLSEAAGQIVAEQLCGSSEWPTFGSVAVFAALAGEVDLSPLVARALRDGKSVLYPRMIAGPSLEFVAVEHPQSLVTGRYGVREPGSTSPAEQLAADALVLLPGVAFDRRGGRVGRGAGYYDRALAHLAGARDRPMLIGVGFAFQVVDAVPVGRHDIRMDRVVTERGFCEID